jgi:Arc/MetJ family transcription regulator
MSVAITAETAQIIQWLEPRRDVDIALRRVLENEIRRRLATYDAGGV